MHEMTGKYFALFLHFDIILNIVRLHINTRDDYKLCVRNNGEYCGNAEIVAVCEIRKVSVGIYFVSEGQVTQPPTVVVG
jgi:hypothetical protein